MKRRVEACDFAFFISVAAPHAPPQKLKTMCDWGNWVFPFDDMFDEGDLKSDQEGSQKVIDSLMNAMIDRPFSGPKLPVVEAHDDVFQRLAEASPRGVSQRFARAMEDYADGVARHVDHFSLDRVPEVQEMLETRQLSAGVTPLYHLVEYAHGLELPDEVFEDPTIQTLERLGVDFVANDILSYRKEENDACPFSMVAACRMTGQSPQQAFNTVGGLLEERYQDWNDSIRRLPSWGPDIDDQVRQYIEGIQNVVQANISWSFRSHRYFGDQASKVRQTSKIDVKVSPAYLQAKQKRSRKLVTVVFSSADVLAPLIKFFFAFVAIFPLLLAIKSSHS
ncbi:hypothetical protein FZEAL_715 [Fusarium zealandicum]|uniref:Terpene synthase n=1 Tax=Fusarium zealandicum TaxID=1053134 RepID=A0A8H4XQ18_9HYPO|nr:hypothetical protein FZEAL_715 [Fusarium zealandicum]